MKTISLHITELYKNFAGAQRRLLRGPCSVKQYSVDGLLDQLVSRCSPENDSTILRQALLDPYFPLDMLERTIFSDVDGMRFYIMKNRPDLEPTLLAELVEWSKAFLRIRRDIQTFFDTKSITCIPLDGNKHPLPTGQWCTLCGVCCQIGGVPPDPPADLRYPDRWYTYLAGGAMDNQQLCPFLFQHFGEPLFFCAIHDVKPVACREFGKQDCRDRLFGRNLHACQATRS